MIDAINLTISDQALADSLQNCKVGESKTLTFTVEAVKGSTLSGDVTAVEGYESEAEDEGGAESEDTAESKPEMGGRMGTMKKKMPGAVIMIAGGK